MMRILIVDDIRENQLILEQILKRLDLEYQCADCISEAVQLATTTQFDAVLMDLAIPKERGNCEETFGGLEAARAILEHSDCQNIPILAVTANGMRDIEDRVMSSGIREIVEKGPNYSERIQAALNRVLQQPVSFATVVKQLVSASASCTSHEVMVETSVSLEQSNELDSNVSLPHKPVVVEQTLVVREETDTVSSPPDVIARVTSLVAEARATAAGLNADIEDIEDGEEFERHDETTKLGKELQQQLEQAYQRLQAPDDGPSPGEPYGHWVINLLLGAFSRCDDLKKLDDEHFGKLSPSVDKVASPLQACAALCKSPGAQFVPVPRTKEVVHSSVAQQDAAHAAATSAHNSRHEAPRPLILIVDDQHEARRDLENKLKRLQFRVVSCESAVTALELLELQRFDVCLLDLNMPEISGLEMIERIRRSKSAANTAIIVVSGMGENFSAAEALERGADDYLQKPPDESLLTARICSCLRKTDARLAELGKFLPQHVLNLVMSNSDLLEKPMPADVSVIVCDIRGFSQVSERIGPVQTINWISDVMNELSQIILEHGGTIIDYVGDEIMAMWGAPIATSHHAEEACRCASAIQVVVARLVRKWRSVINSDFSIGIGINSGLAVVGNTGSRHRIKYGPLGDTVNVASRVQGATKYLHSRILITQSTASRIDAGLKGRRVCSVRVQNINEPVQLFELADKSVENSRQDIEDYEEALDAFESEKLSVALQLLAQLLARNPQDGPAKLLMMRVIQSELGGTFDPIWTLPGK